MTDHQLFLFLVEVGVIVVAARAGGELALRLRMPEVVGELSIGICLGSSVFGATWPAGFRAVFPAGMDQRDLLEIMGWIGVLFLVMLSGSELRLGLLRRAGRVVAWSWVGGFFLPFILGVGLGWMVPSRLVGAGVERPVFALFLGTAMSISAIPVIARILLDLELLRTRVGIVVMSAAVADDTIGWITLAIVTGLASRSGIDAKTVGTALVGTLAFLGLAATLGQWLVRRAVVASSGLHVPFASSTVAIAIVLACAAITQAIHVHLVLGAFVASILIARSEGWDTSGVEALRHVGMALFVPFFFAYTGMKVDLTTLTGSAIPVAVAAIAIACAGKLVGGTAGARLGGMSWREARAVGAALNARGAMGLVIAAVGLSIGVLTLPMYSIVVLIAVVTTLMAAPMLRVFKRSSDPGHSTAPIQEIVV